MTADEGTVKTAATMPTSVSSIDSWRKVIVWSLLGFLALLALPAIVLELFTTDRLASSASRWSFFQPRYAAVPETVVISDTRLQAQPIVGPQSGSQITLSNSRKLSPCDSSFAHQEMPVSASQTQPDESSTAAPAPRTPATTSAAQASTSASLGNSTGADLQVLAAPPRPNPDVTKRQTWLGKKIRQPGRDRNVALCFFGLTRSLSFTVGSIRQSIIKPLETAGYNVDVFLHTYDLAFIDSAWSHEKDALNTSEWHLLEPLEATITSQDDFLLGKRKEIASCEKHGNAWPTSPGFRTLWNHLCQLNSLNEVSQLWQKHHQTEQYQAVVYARPDVLFTCPIPVDIFKDLKRNTLYLPDHNKWGGLNDRFAIGRPAAAIKYGNRINFTFSVCEAPKNRANMVHAEHFMLRMVETLNITAVDIPRFYFHRVRANGLIEVKDLYSQPMCEAKQAGSAHVEFGRAAAILSTQKKLSAQEKPKR